MIKFYTRAAVILFLGMASLSASAQKPKKPFVDTTATFEHFVGLQANALIQQVFNFGETQALANPYVLKYTLKHVPTGLSLNVAGGISKRAEENDAGLATVAESYDLRVGPGWQTALSDRLEFGIGADLILGRSYTESSQVSTVVSSSLIDSTTTILRNERTYFGGGLQASIAYKLSPYLLIGTEASIYAFATEEIENSELDNFIISQGLVGNEEFTFRSIEATNTTTEGDQIELHLPIVLFLILRF